MRIRFKILKKYQNYLKLIAFFKCLWKRPNLWIVENLKQMTEEENPIYSI